MSDLLSIGRSGVLAYQGALQTIGENVTNADTDGYSRRSVVLKEQNSVTGPFSLNRTGSAFGGVNAAGVSRVWDQYKASNAFTANSDSSGASTKAQYLATMESLLNDTDNGVGTRLTAVFTSANQLAANPGDTSQRQAFIASVSDAVSALNTTATNLAKLSGTITTQASLTVTQVNDALGQLARINTALHTATPNTAGRAQLEDQRDSLLGTISGAMSINTDFQTDGSVAVRLNDTQGALLLAARSATPSTVQMQASARGIISLSVQSDDTVQPGVPTGGSLAGLISSAATNGGRRDQLDGLAGSVATLLNNFQTTGVTDAGVAGTAMLTADDPAHVDAASLRLVQPFKAADLALASTDGGSPATITANGNLLTLAGQRGPGGVEQTWKSMVTDQALQVSSANTEASAASTRKDSAYTALDTTTGVDLDNEAAELLRFQQAYSASAKVIQAARETLQDILKLF